MKHVLRTIAYILTVGLMACSQSDAVRQPELTTTNGNPSATQSLTIIETAQSAGVFNTLVAAVETAELVDALNGEGPFTVFAPTDEAFAALPEGTVETLLLPENKQALTDILLYHVVAGQVLAEQAINAAQQNASVATLNGTELALSLDNRGLNINNSLVTSADVFASNGVIHIIDQVLLPPAKPMDIVDTAINNGSFNTLVAAVQAANLEDTLRSAGPFTVFAPTDAAFAALPEGTVETLLMPENLGTLTDILTYHVVSGEVSADQLKMMTKLQTVLGQNVTVTSMNGELFINSSKVTIKNVEASNGIIQVIDTVLIP